VVVGVVVGVVVVVVGVGVVVVGVPAVPDVDWVLTACGMPSATPGAEPLRLPGTPEPHSATGEVAGGVVVGGDVSASAAAGSATAKAPIAVAAVIHLDAVVIGLSFCSAGGAPNA
jgi:hypothetical protein